MNKGTIRQRIVKRKGSRNRILFLLACGHIRSQPICVSKTLVPGKLLRCRDCEALKKNLERAEPFGRWAIHCDDI